MRGRFLRRLAHRRGGEGGSFLTEWCRKVREERFSAVSVRSGDAVARWSGAQDIALFHRNIAETRESVHRQDVTNFTRRAHASAGKAVHAAFPDRRRGQRAGAPAHFTRPDASVRNSDASAALASPSRKRTQDAQEFASTCVVGLQRRSGFGARIAGGEHVRVLGADVDLPHRAVLDLVDLDQVSPYSLLVVCAVCSTSPTTARAAASRGGAASCAGEGDSGPPGERRDPAATWHSAPPCGRAGWDRVPGVTCRPHEPLAGSAGAAAKRSGRAVSPSGGSGPVGPGWMPESPARTRRPESSGTGLTVFASHMQGHPLSRSPKTSETKDASTSVRHRPGALTGAPAGPGHREDRHLTAPCGERREP